ncbi:CDP-glycerol glycerophosphotransferase family protein [Pedobacter immunditicola]|uniref:CDP-glycerol glycerophosphotransferase family protein n=1 Tax=Pedobacter immunditicola TaxID=3133440 RepID=UPI00309F5C29
MKYKKSMVRALRLKFLSALNKMLPKYNRVLIIGFPNVESSAVATANYIASHYDIPVSYVVSKKQKDDPGGLLLPGVKVISSNENNKAQLRFFWQLFTSKYLFLTHGIFLSAFSRRQVVTNIWHGILYKKIGLLIGGRAIPADVTVGTSTLTRKMFSEAFGVPESKVFVSGYPRNDQLLEGKAKKAKVRAQLDTGLQLSNDAELHHHTQESAPHSKNPGLNQYQKVLIWMPTFRKNMNKVDWQDGIESGNPFYIADFDVVRFNQILRENNSFCLVKPHPMAVKYAATDNLSHMAFIDDQWISDRGVTLYQLVGSTDVLISDVSSVVIDYLLLDQPILCVSTDFETYKENRGFYFEAIEEWLPGPVLRSEEMFFRALEAVLKSGMDDYDGKRKNLKERFFTHHDARSTERLVEHVFNHPTK